MNPYVCMLQNCHNVWHIWPCFYGMRGLVAFSPKRVQKGLGCGLSLSDEFPIKNLLSCFLLAWIASFKVNSPNSYLLHSMFRGFRWLLVKDGYDWRS